jgi:3-methyladenine DNA glycosylase AlkD
MPLPVPNISILSHKYINTIIEKAAENGTKCCSAIFLKLRGGIWTEVRQFLQTNAPSLIQEYDELYFKSGCKDLSGYSLPELDYRFKTMKSIAGMCKLNNICFTSEEFLDLWTTKYSDCVDIDSWHAPTAYAFVEFLRCQDATDVKVEEVIDYVKRHFVTEKKWERLMRKYWGKTQSFL